MAPMVQLPSAAVVVVVVATWSPTSRSASTVAPATGPDGPRTVPLRAAPPGRMGSEDGVATAPATLPSSTEDRLDGSVGSGVTGGAVTALQAALTQPAPAPPPLGRRARPARRRPRRHRGAHNPAPPSPSPTSGPR